MANTAVDNEVSLMVSDQDFGELRGLVKSIAEKQDKIDRILFGNGQPGIFESVKSEPVRYEKLNAEIQKLNNTVIAQISGLSEEISKISTQITSVRNDLDTHLNDKSRTFKGFLTDNWKSIIMLFVLGFVFLHAILPPEFTIWEFFENLIK